MSPSIILISIDSLRYDCVSYQSRRPHLDALGIDRLPRTPHLDRLMDRAFRFTQAVSTAPYTTTSHASIFTGRVPPDHGVRSFMSSSLSDDVRSLPEVLAPLGYASLLMSDTPWLFRTVGLDRGFDAVGESLHGARQWWQDNSYRPRLLVLHLMDLHDPYGFRKPSRWLDAGELVQRNVSWLGEVEQFLGAAIATAPCRPHVLERPRQVIRHARALHHHVVTGRDGQRIALQWYLRALERLDAGPLRWLADWFEADGVFDSSIVALFGDHGEGRDHTTALQLAHSCLMYDDVIRMPLSIRVPGEPGDVLDDQTSTVHLAPTLVELCGAGAGWPEPQSRLLDVVNGRSMAHRLFGTPCPPRPAYGEFWQRCCGRQHGRIRETLRQRMLRWPDRKISFIGRALEYGAELAALDAPSFLRRLHGDLCGQAMDAEWRWNLPARILAHSGSWARRALFAWTRHRAGKRPMPKAAEFDLVADPLELNPRPPDGNSAEFQAALRLFESLDARARAATPLRGTRKEMFAVEERLRELGYVD